MPQFRLTFFYEQLENGWSESIHHIATDPLTLTGTSQAYADRRMPFCHKSTFLTHVRISDDLTFRDVLLDPIDLPRQGTWKPAANAEGPWTALDLRLQANPEVVRSMFVRGFPAGQIDSNQPSFTAEFDQAYSRWVQYLRTSGYQIRNKDRTQKKQPINSISSAGAVNMVSPLAGVANLDIVQVLGIPRSEMPQRTFQVVNLTDASNFSLRGYHGPVILGKGYLRRVVYVLLPITQVSTTFATERRVGRPFGVQRGRRAVIR